MDENKNDQYKKHSVFYDLQDGSKQKSVAFMVYDLEFWWRHNFKKQQKFLKC